MEMFIWGSHFTWLTHGKKEGTAQPHATNRLLFHRLGLLVLFLLEQ